MASALAAQARFLALAVRGRGTGPAASRWLVPARRSSSCASATDDDKAFWMKFIVFGGGFLYFWRWKNEYLDREAELLNAKMVLQFYKEQSREQDEEIARLQRAWEELTAREKAKA